MTFLLHRVLSTILEIRNNDKIKQPTPAACVSTVRPRVGYLFNVPEKGNGVGSVERSLLPRSYPLGSNGQSAHQACGRCHTAGSGTPAFGNSYSSLASSSL